MANVFLKDNEESLSEEEDIKNKEMCRRDE